MIPLKYNTASQTVTIGYAVDSTDGNTEETGLTIANTDIKLHKANATTLANKNSGGATHIANGIYYITLDATDTDTYGPLTIYVHVSGSLALKIDCVVMQVSAYNKLYSSSGFNDIAATDIVSGGAITTSSGAVSTVTTVSGSVTVGTNSDKTGYSIAGTKTTLDALNDVTEAQVNAQVDTALSDIGLDHLIQSSLPTSWATDVASGSVFDQIADNGTAVYDRTTDSLQAIRDSVDTAATASATASALATAQTDITSILADTGTTLPAQISAISKTQMTESYAADGTAPTIEQALFMIQQMLGEFYVTGTTLTVKKLDGSTTAATYTLNDGTNPTAITRDT